MKLAIENFRKSLALAEDTLSEVKNQRRKKRSVVVQGLQTLNMQLKDATSYLKTNQFKSYSDVLDMRSEVKTLANLAQSNADGVAAKRVEARELIHSLAVMTESIQMVQDTAEGFIGLFSTVTESSTETRTLELSDLQAMTPQERDRYLASEEFLSIEGKSSKNDNRAIVAAKKTEKLIAGYKARYSAKIPKSLTSVIQTIEVPLAARFSNLAVRADSLNALGFKVKALGLHSTPSSDLGLVFEKQICLLFRRSDAEQCAQEQVQEREQNSGILRTRKARQKERAAVRRELKSVEECIATQIKARKFKAVARLEKEAAGLRNKIQEVTTSLEQLEAKTRNEKSILRASKKMLQDSDHAMLNYLSAIVDALNNRMGTDLTLFTTRTLSGLTKDADVLGAWLMPKSEVRLMLTHTGGDPKLAEWSLPWNHSVSYQADAPEQKEPKKKLKKKVIKSKRLKQGK